MCWMCIKTKGWKVAKVHTVTVWYWDGKEEKARKRTLVITISEKTKFSLSGADKEEYTNKGIKPDWTGSVNLGINYKSFSLASRIGICSGGDMKCTY